MSKTIEFPKYTGIRCLMMPYIQGDFDSVPGEYATYREIIETVYVEKGDIGHVADQYPYEDAIFMKAGQVEEIGILTPHESIPVKRDFKRQFLRIVGSGVHGREPYFTVNPKMGV